MRPFVSFVSNLLFIFFSIVAELAFYIDCSVTQNQIRAYHDIYIYFCFCHRIEIIIILVIICESHHAYARCRCLCCHQRKRKQQQQKWTNILWQKLCACFCIAECVKHNLFRPHNFFSIGFLFRCSFHIWIHFENIHHFELFVGNTLMVLCT